VDRQRLFAAQELAMRLRAELETLFRLTDVLLAPSARGEAPAGLDSTGDPVFSRMWSLLGAPCVQVPAGRGSHGLPLGVTLIGPRWRDTRVLGAAQMLEQALA
jgi:amidase